MWLATVFNLVFLVAGEAKPKPDPFQPLRDQLDAWVFTENFAVSVGNSSHGTVFSYEHGKMTMHTKVGTASTSKWPLAMMFVGLVNDGTIKSLDDPAHKYVTWWTSDPKDKRSRVTLRHLLSFTSGFGGGAPGIAGKSVADNAENSSATSCLGHYWANYLGCAKQIYNTVSMQGEPGTVYSYNSYHLQLAGAVAQFASGLTIQQILRKYLFKPYGMTQTTCQGKNPELAVCLTTTGHDYGNFLAGVEGYKVLPKSLVDESEKDYTPFLSNYYTLYGDYGFGHFLECFDNPAGYTEECKKAQVHSDPGAFGFYPLIDRANGYWMQIVAFESGQFYPRSGIPEYLRVAVKPLVDAIMTGDPYVPYTATHHYPEFQALTLSDVNYIAKCYTNPQACQSSQLMPGPLRHNLHKQETATLMV
jgi:CubicO group peptidase (beta-lactamase class C family)